MKDSPFPLAVSPAHLPAGYVPASGSDPVTYSVAAGLLVAASASTDGHNWGVAAVISEALPAPSNFSLANLTANCTPSWFHGTQNVIHLPATPASALPGTSNAYLSLLVNSSTQEAILADVLNGSASLVVSVTQGGGCNIANNASVLPSDVIDSPQVIALANASGGAAFLGLFPHSIKELELSPSNGLPAWLVIFTSRCGAVFEAEFSAINGYPYGFLESDVCLYNVTFSESGLAPSTSWNVELPNNSYFSSGPYVNFSLANGTYPFTVNGQGYTAAPPSGSLVIAGANVTQPEVFSVLPANYTSTFTEHGLAPGASWSVFLNGNFSFFYANSQGTSLAFVVPNGTYSYNASATGYTADRSQGHSNVTGADINTEINFTALTSYNVTFTESGLATGSDWSVELNVTDGPNYYASSSNTTAVVSVPNGSYTYYLYTPANGYQASPSSGPLVVGGSALGQSVTFVQEVGYFAANFTESGLPAGDAWGVVLNGSYLLSSNTSSAVLLLQNGTYPFTVFSVYGYSSTPVRGNVTVAGATSPVSITYSAASDYIVTFSETGLPNGAPFWVTVDNLTTVTETGEIAYFAVNGATPFTAGTYLPNYHASPSGGVLTVAGLDVGQTIVFTHVTLFPVLFTEVGLLPSTNWSVNLSGLVNASITPNLTFLVSNGSYGFQVLNVSNYTASPSSGTVGVNGTGAVVLINFTAIPLGDSVVTFQESGLPAGASWSVNYTNGTNVSAFLNSSGPTVEVALAPGLYNATANTTAAGFLDGGVPLSFLVVTGVNMTELFTFFAFTHNVTFVESGLPGGTMWWVNVTAGPSVSSTGPNGSVVVANGSYTYTLASANKSFAAPSAMLNISTTTVNVTVDVTFSLVTYHVTFTETGLPATTAWWVNVTGQASLTATGTTIVSVLPNGTYTYTVATANKTYLASGGHVTVSGAAQSVTVAYALVTYSVVFTETGLPVGAHWWVNVTSGPSVSSTGTTATALLANGTYTYSIASANKSFASTGGHVTVTGAASSPAITFAEVTYLVTFTETNLPSGTNWSITIGASTVYSHTTTIQFNESNGTYAYSVGSVSGYGPNASSGHVTVSGAAAGGTVVFSSNSSAASFLGLPGNEGYYLLAGIVIVIVVLGSLAAMMMRHRGPKTGKEAPPPASGSTETPSDASGTPTTPDSAGTGGAK